MNARNLRPSKFRWFRFSLRTLLVTTIVCALILGRIGDVTYRVRRQRQIVARIEKLGGRCGYSEQYASGADARRPTFFGVIFGTDAIPKVNTVFWKNDAVQDSDLNLLNEFPHLAFLELQGKNVTDDGLNSLQRLKHLRYLTFTETKVTGRGIARLEAASKIEFLMFEGSTTGDSTLDGIGQLSNLRTLWLKSKSVITEAGFLNLKDLSSLETLLVYVPVSDQSLGYLSEMPHLTRLEMVSPTTEDAGIRYLKNAKTLVRLNVSRTKITDAAIDDLVEMSQLRELTIMFNAITDTGIQKLAQLRQLKRLAVGPGISTNAATELGRLLPSCQIRVWDGTKYVEIKPTQ